MKVITGHQVVCWNYGTKYCSNKYPLGRILNKYSYALFLLFFLTNDWVYDNTDWHCEVLFNNC